MAVNVDLTGFSVEELNELIRNVKGEIARRDDQIKKDAMAKIKAIAEEAGLSAAEIAKGTRRTRAAAKPKYRNPSDPTQTWSGRGKRQRWFEAALSGGAAMEDMLNP